MTIGLEIWVWRLSSGLLLGGIFFGGLWWTIRRGLSSTSPALWFFGSLLLRTSVASADFTGFRKVTGVRLLACLLGFLMARVLIICKPRITPAATGKAGVIGGRIMNLSSDQAGIVASRFLRSQRNHRDHMGHDDRDESAPRSLLAPGTEGPISRWQSALEIIVTTIERQIKEVGLSRAQRILAISRHTVSFRCDVEPVYHDSGFRTAHGLLVDDGRPRAVRFSSPCRSSVSRNRA